MNINSALLCDGYKLDHKPQYPWNTITVESNWTPRMSRIPGVSKVVVFGIQYFFIKYIQQDFDKNFFSQPIEKVIAKFKRRINGYLGPDKVGDQHIRDLHELGYLPIEVRALPEGSLCPIGVPMLTIKNTLDPFFWVTNFLETIMSCVLWKPMTSATTAFEYLKEFTRHAKLTGSPVDFIPWQGHDFSFRGMSGLEDACMSSAGHLLSFTGTDTIPAIDFLEEFYHADSDKELIAGSVPATEHSVMCMGKEENEIDTFRRLINEIYPDGPVSIVSDSWDFWRVMTEYLPALKDDIMRRDGRVIIRPDSGDPVDIICGKEDGIPRLDSSTDWAHDFMIDLEDWDDKIICIDDQYYRVDGVNDFIREYGMDSWSQVDKLNMGDMVDGGKCGVLTRVKVGSMLTKAEIAGAYEIMWNIFGGTINDKGYKVLDPHIGLIYGDSITMERQKDILRRLEAKGFAASNLVLGIGSFTYEYVTRDTFGFAMKATHGRLANEDGTVENRMIFKDPKTDSGFKKSAKGLLMVVKDAENGFRLIDQVTLEQQESEENELKLIFADGKFIKEFSLAEIRATLKSQL